jgi:hypothetical protein
MGLGDRDGNDSTGRERYEEGLPGYHDPTAGIGGASPARSALTLRLVLAGFGLLTSTALAIWVWSIGAPVGFVIALAVLAVTAIVDIAVILYRKRRGEPG